MPPAVRRLVDSETAVIRYKTRLLLLGANPDAREMQALQEEVHRSPLVRPLLVGRVKGQLPYHPYCKWLGALLPGRPEIPGRRYSLQPLLEQVYQWLFSIEHNKRICSIEGRVRRCASQEGNALYYTLALGLEERRVHELVERLIVRQLPDSGWNCDRRPERERRSLLTAHKPDICNNFLVHLSEGNYHANPRIHGSIKSS